MSAPTASQTEDLQNFPKNRKMLIYVGSLFLALCIACYGLSLSTVQMPMLVSMNAEWAFTLVTAISMAGLCIATPIGGALLDRIGTRKVVLVFGAVMFVCALFIAFIPNVFVYLIFRTILAVCQGALSSIPFIIVRQVFELKEVPKYIGFISAMFAIGSLVGSYLAGFFVDHNMMAMSVLFPAVFLLIGMAMLVKELPNQQAVQKIPLDLLGLVLLSITLLGLVFALNFAPTVGWENPWILVGFALFAVGLVLLIWREQKCPYALIPLRIFTNGVFDTVILISFFCSIYITAINVYIPMAAQSLIGMSAAGSGTLQMPRTIISVILPGLAGAYVAKSYKNNWKSLALASIIIAIACSFLVFIGKNMPVWFIMVILALTGIADSLRTVCALPVAQQVLPAKDLGVGTSLVGFMISLAGVLGSATFAIAYNSMTTAYPGDLGVTWGVDTVLWLSAAAAYIALLLVLFGFRPLYNRFIKISQENQTK